MHGEAGSERALARAFACGSSGRRGDGGTESTGLRASSSGERRSEEGRACGCDGESESGDGRSICGQADGTALGVEAVSDMLAAMGWERWRLDGDGDGDSAGDGDGDGDGDEAGRLVAALSVRSVCLGLGGRGGERGGEVGSASSRQGGNKWVFWKAIAELWRGRMR